MPGQCWSTWCATPEVRLYETNSGRWTIQSIQSHMTSASWSAPTPFCLLSWFPMPAYDPSNDCDLDGTRAGAMISSHTCSVIGLMAQVKQHVGLSAVSAHDEVFLQPCAACLLTPLSSSRRQASCSTGCLLAGLCIMLCIYWYLQAFA